jgi:hypothetical protein
MELKFQIQALALMTPELDTKMSSSDAQNLTQLAADSLLQET